MQPPMQSMEATLQQTSGSVARQAGQYRDASVNASPFKRAMYQKMELEKNADIAIKNQVILDLRSYVRVPLTGYVLQGGSPAGVFADQWVESHAQVEIQPPTPVSGVLLRGWRPEKAPPGWVRLVVGDAFVESPVAHGTFEVTLKLPQTAKAPFRLHIDMASQGRSVDPAIDSRDLAFRVAEIRAKHPLVQTLTKMLG